MKQKNVLIIFGILIVMLVAIIIVLLVKMSSAEEKEHRSQPSSERTEDSEKKQQVSPKDKKSLSAKSDNAGQGFYEFDDGEELTLKFKTDAGEVKRKGLYKGELKDGVPNGEGEFLSQNLEGVRWVCSGHWKDGILDGKVSIYWEDPDNYSKGKGYQRYMKGNFSQGTCRSIDMKRIMEHGSSTREGNYPQIEIDFKVPEELKNFPEIQEPHIEVEDSFLSL